jgi:Flp pilus assembly protein TadD
MQTRTSHRPWAGRSNAAALVLLIIASSAPLIAQEGGSGGAIEGQILTIDSSPVPSDITVRLEAAEGAYMDQTMVKTDGKFTFTNLKQGLYTVVVRADGYKTATHTVDMNWLASRQARILLVPDVKVRLSSSSSPTLTSSDLSAPKTAKKEFEKGLQDLENGNFGGAQKHLEKAVAEHPCYARAHTMLGMTFSMKGQLEDSERAFNKSIECDSGFVEAYIQYAKVLNSQNKYPACVATIHKGLRRFPNEWLLHYQLGIAMDGSGDYAAGEAALLKAQSINPEVPPEFHLRLADVYLNLQKYEDAHAEMASYLRAAPRGTYSEPTRKIMRQLEASGMVAKAQGKNNPKK